MPTVIHFYYGWKMKLVADLYPATSMRAWYVDVRAKIHISTDRERACVPHMTAIRYQEDGSVIINDHTRYGGFSPNHHTEQYYISGSYFAVSFNALGQRHYISDKHRQMTYVVTRHKTGRTKIADIYHEAIHVSHDESALYCGNTGLHIIPPMTDLAHVYDLHTGQQQRYQRFVASRDYLVGAHDRNLYFIDQLNRHTLLDLRANSAVDLVTLNTWMSRGYTVAKVIGDGVIILHDRDAAVAVDHRACAEYPLEGPFGHFYM